jgi:hypothetical protein
MAESGLTVTFMPSLSFLLVVMSAAHRYTRNFIIPGVTFLVFLGSILATLPIIGLDVEEFYDIFQGIPEIMLFNFF